MRNSSLGPYIQPDFSPPEYIVVVNALFYASLGIMLLAAFIAMLIISWVHEFDHGLAAISIPEQRAKTREFRYLGMERWKLEEMVAMLPLLIQISLLLFAVGLVLFLFRISKPSFGVTTAIFGVGVLYYAVTTTISVFVTSSPFHSPLSRALGRVYQYVHAYFCPGLDIFLSPNMDITPRTAFGRLRRHVQIFFQKSRPYLERDFVKPITATTLDDVQLSTAASALQRIHDSVPNSEHSALIQQSVWQVASSPALRMRPLLGLPSWILDDKESFSRLSTANVVALTAVFVSMRDVRHRKRIAGVEDICRGVGESWGPWDQLVHAIFGLLPDNLINNDYDYNNTDIRLAFRFDALFRQALPTHYLLRNRVLHTSLKDSDLSLWLWSNLHVGRIWCNLRCNVHKFDRRWILKTHYHCGPLLNALRDALRNTPLRVVYAYLRDILVGDASLDDMALQGRLMRLFLTPKVPNELLRVLRDNELHEDETLWLLSTLSRLHCDGLVLMAGYASRICLAVLLHQAPKWNQMTPPNIMLTEAVVTLVAVSSFSNETHQMKTLTNSHQHSWLLLNLRNPDLISRMMDEIDDDCREELISLLFLVIYALTLRGSKNLARLYLDIITARADFTLCASALSTIAPALGDDGFRAFSDLLLWFQAEFLTPAAMSNDMSDFPQVGRSHQPLLENYDLRLGARLSPAPKHAAILLLLLKDRQTLHIMPRIPFKNPWLQCVEKVDLGWDTPYMDMRSFPDHRVHNMFGALSLLRYSAGPQIYNLRPVNLLASFLEASNPAISCPVLYHYMEMFGNIMPPPPRCISGALQIVFNPLLPGHHLPRGWVILDRFLHKFDNYPAQWRQIFAEAFFSQSRRPLLKGSRQKGTPGGIPEIRNILTWEYFCQEAPKHAMSDVEFSGLDWMAMAWSFHLSQPSGSKLTVSAQEKKQPEQFVLRVLCHLLEAAQYHSIIPVIPRLREFVEWFDDSEHFEYKSAICVRIEGAVRDQEWKMLYNFEKFHCMWSI